MVRRAIPLAIEQRVHTMARNRCGYCLSPQHLVMARLEIAHIIPLAQGGTNEESNLWLACPLCNGHKSDKVAALYRLDERTALAAVMLRSAPGHAPPDPFPAPHIKFYDYNLLLSIAHAPADAAVVHVALCARNVERVSQIARAIGDEVGVKAIGVQADIAKTCSRQYRTGGSICSTAIYISCYRTALFSRRPAASHAHTVQALDIPRPGVPSSACLAVLCCPADRAASRPQSMYSAALFERKRCPTFTKRSPGSRPSAGCWLNSFCADKRRARPMAPPPMAFRPTA